MRGCCLARGVFGFGQSKPRLFVFAGQGTQQKGMLDTLLSHPQAHKEITLHSNNLSLNFPQITHSDPNSLLSRTSVVQPLLVLSQVLHFKYLSPYKLQPEDYMLGHSIGEYSALCLAGCIELGEVLNLVRARGRMMEECAGEGGMVIVRFADGRWGEVQGIVRQAGLEIACYNTPNNVNVSGPLAKLQAARTSFKQAKITCLPLPVSTAFHCSLLTPMLVPYTAQLTKLHFSTPKARILRNLDTELYQADADIKEGLARHLTHPVMFWQSVARVDPEIECVEIGHNRMIKKFVDETRKKMKSASPQPK